MTNANVTTRIEGRAVHLTISGEVDIENAAAIEHQVLDAIDNLATDVKIDLTDLRYMDSSGLRILFALAVRLEMLQITLQVIAPPGTPARRVLELAGYQAL